MTRLNETKLLVEAADTLGTAIALVETIDMAVAGAMLMDDQEREALRALVKVSGDTAREALALLNSGRRA